MADNSIPIEALLADILVRLTVVEKHIIDLGLVSREQFDADVADMTKKITDALTAGVTKS